MVVQGLIALALALPTGMLFGVGYGTGVRIGYEQVYPLLFPKSDKPVNAEQVATNLKEINKIYDTIGGKEASNMGIANGINAVRTATEDNPDFRYLEELESRLSGRTPSSSDPRNSSHTTSSSAQAESSNTLGEAARKALDTQNKPTGDRRNLTPQVQVPQPEIISKDKVNLQNQIKQQFNNVTQKTSEVNSINKVHNQLIKAYHDYKNGQNPHHVIAGKKLVAANKMGEHLKQARQLLKIYSNIYNTTQLKYKAKFGSIFKF